VGDQHDRRVQGVAQLAQQTQDLRLDGDVQRGGRLVGDDDLRVAGDRHGDDDALAQAARELVRVLLEPLLGVRDADHVEQLDGALVGGVLGDVEVRTQGLAQLPADRVDRVQRRHRLLEDHRDLVAADLLHVLLFEVRQVALAQAELAGDPAGLGQQAQHRHRRDGLAGPGLPDHGDDLAGLHVEPDALDGVHDAVLGLERHAEVRDRQDRSGHAGDVRRSCFSAHQDALRGGTDGRDAAVATRARITEGVPDEGRSTGITLNP
jgi:hypothetical protein